MRLLGWPSISAVLSTERRVSVLLSDYWGGGGIEVGTFIGTDQNLSGVQSIDSRKNEMVRCFDT